MVNAQNNVKGYWAPRTRTQKGTGRGAPPTNTESCRSTYCKIFVLPKTFCFWVFLEFNVVWDCFFTVIFVEFYFLGTVFSLSFFIFLTLLWLFFFTVFSRVLLLKHFLHCLLSVLFSSLTNASPCFFYGFSWENHELYLQRKAVVFTLCSGSSRCLHFNVVIFMLVMFVTLYTPAKHPCWEIMVDYRTYMCPLPGGQRQHHLLAHQGGPGRAGPVPEQRWRGLQVG